MYLGIGIPCAHVPVWTTTSKPMPERFSIPQSALHNPHWIWPAVSRIDNVYGDRNPVCTCVGMEAYQS